MAEGFDRVEWFAGLGAVNGTPFSTFRRHPDWAADETGLLMKKSSRARIRRQLWLPESAVMWISGGEPNDSYE
ncbi:hypothetical protein [Nocardia sp. NPDC052112]|uniref:hypothetical protein n=1 Tax=Nocardia sp. NPDC052112 TaxID=3155646 RepID=UPI003446B2D9